jgi:hypothetical protein
MRHLSASVRSVGLPGALAKQLARFWSFKSTTAVPTKLSPDPTHTLKTP